MISSLGEKNVVGRKIYQCGLCERNIHKGELHYTNRCADGDSIWTYRAHLACEAALIPFLKWCGIIPPWLDDYEDVDHEEFRKYIDTGGNYA